MIKCKKCGATIPDGHVFCPKCGTEIQLVPDFYSSESVSYAKKKRKEDEETERRKRQIEDEQFARKIQVQRRKRKISLTIFFLSILAIICIAIFSFLFVKNSNSFEYQMTKAQNAYSQQQYENALKYVNRCLKLDDKNIQATLLKAEININLRQTDTAVELLLSIISNNSENVDAYKRLIQLYYDNGEFDQIKSLLDDAKSDKIKDEFSSYICESPTFSSDDSGDDGSMEITLSAKSSTDIIYYTLDGSEPDILSTKYTHTIVLLEGTHTIKAIAYNSKGIMSDIITQEYYVADE